MTWGRYLLYIDDTALEKIEVYKDRAFMFAGNGRLIQSWKDWIRTGPTDSSGMPPVDGICVAGIDIPSKTVKLSEGLSISFEGAVFAGSGALHAQRCWKTNRNARMAVTSATALDPATGGDVKHFCCSTRENNLGTHVFAPYRIEDIDRAIMERGNIMDRAAAMGGSVPFKVSDLAANDKAELQAAVARGELSAEAPCDAMANKWTEDAKDRLGAFLADTFNWKK